MATLLGRSAVLANCPANSAEFPSAQVEPGRQWNMQNQIQPNMSQARLDTLLDIIYNLHYYIHRICTMHRCRFCRCIGIDPPCPRSRPRRSSRRSCPCSPCGRCTPNPWARIRHSSTGTVPLRSSRCSLINIRIRPSCIGDQRNYSCHALVVILP